jgi:hypothetical protein
MLIRRLILKKLLSFNDATIELGQLNRPDRPERRRQK